jgi:hypothetical protein
VPPFHLNRFLDGLTGERFSLDEVERFALGKRLCVALYRCIVDNQAPREEVTT